AVAAYGGWAIDRHEALDRLQLAADRVDRLRVVAGGDQQLGPGVVEDVAPLGWRQSVVERNRNDAGLGGGEVQQDVLDTVLREDADPVADLQAGANQSVSQLVGDCQRVAVGDAPIALDGELRVAVLARAKVEQIEQ